jgi:hypothetical protein
MMSKTTTQVWHRCNHMMSETTTQVWHRCNHMMSKTTTQVWHRTVGTMVFSKNFAGGQRWIKHGIEPVNFGKTAPNSKTIVHRPNLRVNGDEMYGS